MTETGRESTIERLKRLHATRKNVYEENFRMVSPAQLAEYYAMHDAFPALLAVVEAAQEAADLYEEYRTGNGADEDDLLEAVYKLNQKLAALHSQASDEGKASDG